MGLGINKDLEPLVREVRRAGGTVEVTRSTHVRWTLPDGTVYRSGLTMNGGMAQKVRRDIERALGIEHRHRPKDATSGEPAGRVEAVGKKFRVIGPDGEPLRNAQGFPRTFSSVADAAAAAAGLCALRVAMRAPDTPDQGT